MSVPIRLNKILKELNISLGRAVEFLESKGVEVENNPNAKIDEYAQNLLISEFQGDMNSKRKSELVSEEKRREKEAIRAELEALSEEPKPKEQPAVVRAKANLAGIKEVGKIDLDAPRSPKPEPKSAETPAPQEVAAVSPEPEPAKPALEIPEVPAPQTRGNEPEAAPEQDFQTPVAKVESDSEAPVVEAPNVSTPSAPKVNIVRKAASAVAETAPAPEDRSTPAPASAPPAEAQGASAEAALQGVSPSVVPTSEPETPETPSSVGPDSGGTALEGDHIQTKFQKLEGPRFTGEKIDLTKFERPKKPVATSNQPSTGGAGGNANARKRKRINPTGTPAGPAQGNRPPRPGGPAGGAGGNRSAAPRVEPTEQDIQKQIKETYEKLTSRGKSKGSKIRRAKREERREQEALQEQRREEANSILNVTEFVTVKELATMMDVPITEVIAACMSLGIMVTMNQRLDAETLTIVAEEFGYSTHFVDADVQEAFELEADADEDLKPRAPIVTVMGHVDHGKTSLLDYIRKANVIAGESGGITQHIGAYSVELSSGQRIAFLDTPGHEAFTAMRARGAQVTDVVIIVVAADDDVMPQTREAIAHAQAAGVPFVIAINKIDRPTANPEKIRERLSGMNILVEEWGGKVQSQEISAKTGLGVEALLDKVLLEAEILDLKANPDRLASGTIIEAALDKGRGYISTIMVQNGTLKVGDYVLAGPYSGKVRAMLDERGQRIEEAGPAMPASLLGLDGAPQAGDKFVVMADEREAKQIATRRQQLQREQTARTKKNITLEEIGRRLAIGDFQELNIVLKGDVDGSIEALSDSLQKLSTEKIQVNIIHKAVGQISESDVLLAAASNAIVVGFQVRPSGNARKLAEREEVDIRLYSIIYDAINEVRSAMEGMLAPETKEEVTCNVEVRDIFKISKVGTVAGCMVLDGTITRNTRVRLIRDGVVQFTGELGSLKRFKDDVKEVARGFECGLNLHNYNDIKVGDIIEGFKEVQVKSTL
ncbi:translation initiation factor IF-2 [bacterium]|nr:translation initiation factor IF-2 [bacterium]